MSQMPPVRYRTHAQAESGRTDLTDIDLTDIHPLHIDRSDGSGADGNVRRRQITRSAACECAV